MRIRTARKIILKSIERRHRKSTCIEANKTYASRQRKRKTKTYLQKKLEAIKLKLESILGGSIVFIDETIIHWHVPESEMAGRSIKELIVTLFVKIPDKKFLDKFVSLLYKHFRKALERNRFNHTA